MIIGLFLSIVIAADRDDFDSLCEPLLRLGTLDSREAMPPANEDRAAQYTSLIPVRVLSATEKIQFEQDFTRLKEKMTDFLRCLSDLLKKEVPIEQLARTQGMVSNQSEMIEKLLTCGFKEDIREEFTEWRKQLQQFLTQTKDRIKGEGIDRAIKKACYFCCL